MSQIEEEKLKKMNERQLLMKKRVDERPKMEKLMKENIQWEIEEAKINLNMLKKEKAEYKTKLEDYVHESKVSYFSNYLRNILKPLTTQSKIFFYLPLRF